MNMGLQHPSALTYWVNGPRRCIKFLFQCPVCIFAKHALLVRQQRIRFALTLCPAKNQHAKRKYNQCSDQRKHHTAQAAVRYV